MRSTAHALLISSSSSGYNHDEREQGEHIMPNHPPLHAHSPEPVTPNPEVPPPGTPQPGQPDTVPDPTREPVEPDTPAIGDPPPEPPSTPHARSRMALFPDL
jgi:hypothetical protein